MIADSLIRYILSDAYSHREDYLITKDVIIKYLDGGRAIRADVPSFSPSVCLHCLMVIESRVHYGKLWKGCPLCSISIDSDIDKRATTVLNLKLLDVYALLSPILYRWEIDSLVASTISEDISHE